MYINLKVKFLPKQWERNFSANQMTVISRELFELIRGKVPEVMKKTIPVFKR